MSAAMKSELKQKAIYFRKVEGLSINSICEKLKVAKSTISLWVRDIKLSKEQQLALDSRNPAKHAFNGRRVVAEFNKETARNNRQNLQEIGKKESSDFNLHLAGCMLYWAEGNKRRDSVGFTNTDPNMILLFLRFLKEIYFILDEKIVITCRSHVLSPYSLEECENYWIKILGLSRANLRKGTIETRIPKAKKVKCPYGICSIRVYDIKIVQRIFGSIKQYANIDDANLWI